MKDGSEGGFEEAGEGELLQVNPYNSIITNPHIAL